MNNQGARGRKRRITRHLSRPARQLFDAVVLDEAERAALPQPPVQFVRPAYLPQEDLFARTPELTSTDGLVGTVGYVRKVNETASILSAFGSCAMVAPGLVLTATHVYAEAVRRHRQGRAVVVATPRAGSQTVLWQITDQHSFETVNDAPAIIGRSNSEPVDVCLIAVSPMSALPDRPLYLAHCEIARPRVGERLWAIGFRKERTGLHQLVSSGIVTHQAFAGQGNVPSACVQVEMTAPGGMSGGPVFNSLGHIIGVVSKGIGDQDGTCTVSLIWPAVVPAMKPEWPQALYPRPLTLTELSSLGLSRLHGSARFEDGGIHAEPFDQGSLVGEADLPAALSVVCPPPLLVGLLTPTRRVLACLLQGVSFTNCTAEAIRLESVSLELTVDNAVHSGRLAQAHLSNVEGHADCILIQVNQSGHAAYQVLRGWRRRSPHLLPLSPLAPQAIDCIFVFDSVPFPDKHLERLTGQPTRWPDIQRVELIASVEGMPNSYRFQVSIGGEWRDQLQLDPMMSESA